MQIFSRCDFVFVLNSLPHSLAFSFRGANSIFVFTVRNEEAAPHIISHSVSEFSPLKRDLYLTQVIQRYVFKIFSTPSE